MRKAIKATKHKHSLNSRDKRIWREAEEMQFLNPKYTLRQHYRALKNNVPLE